MIENFVQALARKFGYNLSKISQSNIRILWVRHGESDGNVNPEAYILEGDSNVGLTGRGWQQLIGTGLFFREYLPEIGVTEWPLFHVSTHVRTMQSLTGVLHGMGPLFEGKPAVNPQAFLTEKFFGAASALSFFDDKIVPREFRDYIRHMSEAVYKGDPLSARHIFGESTKDNMIATKIFTDGTLDRDIREGEKIIIVIGHGAVIQSVLMNWMHVLPKDKGLIGNPGNGDVIEISGTSKNWSFKRIWDGQNGVRVDEDYRSRIKRFTVDDLPPLPEEFRNFPSPS